MLTAEATYHKAMPTDVVRRLQHCYAPGAMYLRHRADRIAIHPTKDVVFEWECKTHMQTNRHDWTMEALPLCHHVAAYREFGIDCLYAYSNPFKDHRRECGFWTSSFDFASVRCVMIPGVWTQEGVAWFRKQFTRYLPDTPILSSPRNAGSGDPFLIIDESNLGLFSDWRKLIDQRLTEE